LIVEALEHPDSLVGYDIGWNHGREQRRPVGRDGAVGSYGVDRDGTLGHRHLISVLRRFSTLSGPG